jgi:hypothetical protein
LLLLLCLGVLTTLFVVLYPALYPSCFRPPLLNAKIREVVFEKKKTSWQLKLCNSLYQFPQSLSNPSEFWWWPCLGPRFSWRRPKEAENPAKRFTVFLIFSNHVKDYDYEIKLHRQFSVLCPRSHDSAAVDYGPKQTRCTIRFIDLELYWGRVSNILEYISHNGIKGLFTGRKIWLYSFHPKL